MTYIQYGKDITYMYSRHDKYKSKGGVQWMRSTSKGHLPVKANLFSLLVCIICIYCYVIWMLMLFFFSFITCNSAYGWKPFCLIQLNWMNINIAWKRVVALVIFIHFSAIWAMESWHEWHFCLKVNITLNKKYETITDKRCWKASVHYQPNETIYFT